MARSLYPTRQPHPHTSRDLCDAVRIAGLTLPGVTASTTYDGSPVLKRDGAFMAGLATHRSAEPHSLIVRVDLEARQSFLDDAPDTYYVTDHYRRHPVILVRLKRTEPHALRDLLTMSWRLTGPRSLRTAASRPPERSADRRRS